MLNVPVYSLKGTKLGQMSLPKEYGKDLNLTLLAQAIRVYGDRSHVGLSKTKTRAEVNRTKKKWYRQKGTGGARHGAKSAPIFVGGGVAHGPRPIKRTLKLPAKMKKNSLISAISLKAKNNEIFVLDGFNKLEKTKEVASFLKKLPTQNSKVGKKYTFIVKEENRGARKVVDNFANARVISFRNINPYQVFYGGTLIVDKDIFETKKLKEKKPGKEAKKL